jgi:hypothetical protein
MSERIEQAKRNAEWWDREIAAGRVNFARDFKWLLLDLKAVGKPV